LGDQIKEGEMGGACGTYGEKRNAYRGLVVKLERKRPFGRAGRRWKGNIKMDLREIGMWFANWIYLDE
jgi:hypothetical protein